VCGGLGDRNLDGARGRVATAVEILLPHAEDAGVRLAIEPMHPMFCADRGVVSTVDGALELAAPFPAELVGLVIDTYHVWWDERIWSRIADAGAAGRIACFQVSDWITPLPAGVLLGRGLPGSGCIELRRFVSAMDAAGYTGPIEVEVFNADLWSRSGPDILRATIAAYLEHVA
jgi:sugar phosphate isomerase/epimerase